MKETLQEKGSQLLEAQHLLVNKDQKLKQLVDCLDTHETELVKMREKVKEKPEIPTRLYMATHLQEQFGVPGADAIASGKDGGEGIIVHGSITQFGRLESGFS